MKIRVVMLLKKKVISELKLRFIAIMFYQLSEKFTVSEARRGGWRRRRSGAKVVPSLHTLAT